MDYQLQPFGDNAVMVIFGEKNERSIHQHVQKLADFLQDNPFDWMTAYIPAFTNITLFYEPIKIMQENDTTDPYSVVCKDLESVLGNLQHVPQTPANTIDIPVCYGGAYGPDLEVIAKHNQLTREEVIRIHSQGDYLVYMIGFSPAFPYIGGMSDKINTPRKATPRISIPAGSVGIAGGQTGIYPLASPGGWQIIGRTPLKLFQPASEKPSLLKAGDRVRFTPISEMAYQKWGDAND